MDKVRMKVSELEDADRLVTKDEAKGLLLHIVQALVIIVGVYVLLKAKQTVSLYK